MVLCMRVALPLCVQVRLGIGACQFHLGNFARARQAFRRVLQLSPGNTAALVGLAVLAMNEPTLTPAHITEALQLLCQVTAGISSAHRHRSIPHSHAQV